MTGIEPLIDSAAGGLVSIIFDIAKRVGGESAQALSDRAKATTALKKYTQRYASRYGVIRILGMRQDLPLETIYTKVRFLDELSIRHFASLESLEKTYRENKSRRFQIRESSNLDGFWVANKHQHLMILGGPGAGKSTFLRRIGLEALKGKEGIYKHQCIPVFLELKQFNSDEVDLVRAISNELQNFGFPSSENFAVKALETGKLLILFDGLDEVPKVNTNKVIDTIQGFVTCYDQNRYIASCRIAAHRSNWNRFEDIELADFDDNQVQDFIKKWFSSELDCQAKVSERCWQLLNDSGNTAAKELAHTPLLLIFLCLVYNKTQGFPGNRATLYRKALDILLEEWAAEKRINSGEIYQGLNTDLEKVLLSEIAYRGFINDRLFFMEQELVEQIKAFLADTVDKPKYLDGKAVLHAIAVQQGILVERAEDVFSFSHLTVQEYLVAQYINQDIHSMAEIIEKHLTDERWREVFILMAGLMQNADSLLKLMEQRARKFLSSEKLKSLLNWVHQVTVNSEGKFKRSAKRAVALAIAIDHEHALRGGQRKLPVFSLIRSLDTALLITQDLDPDLFSAFDRASVQNLDEMKIFENVNFTLVVAKMKAAGIRAFMSHKVTLEEKEDNERRVRRIWLDALSLNQELLELPEREAEQLENYLYAIELIISCKKAAIRVSEKVWNEFIEKVLTVEGIE